jgi:triacylglycerol lipase
MPLARKAIPRRLRDWKYQRPPCLTYDYFAAAGQVPIRHSPTAMASWLADAALLSYAEPEFAEPAFTKAGFSSVRFVEKAGTHAYLLEIDDLAVACFRGTQVNRLIEMLTDLKTDLSFVAVESAGLPGKVHTGFRAALDLIWDEIAPALIDAAGRGKSVLLSGHSLGGALALLGAVRLAKPARVVTFACPRIGSEEFAEAAKGIDIDRYVIAGDLVPRLPPRRWGYVDIGQRRVLEPNGSISVTPDLPRLYEVDSVSDAVENWGKALRLNLFDHSPVLYATLAYNALMAELGVA